MKIFIAVKLCFVAPDVSKNKNLENEKTNLKLIQHLKL